MFVLQQSLSCTGRSGVAGLRVDLSEHLEEQDNDRRQNLFLLLSCFSTWITVVGKIPTLFSGKSHTPPYQRVFFSTFCDFFVPIFRHYHCSFIRPERNSRERLS